MQQFTEKIERSLFRIFLAIAALIALLAFAGYFSLRAFHGWQKDRLLTQANALLHDGDYKRASLDAERVLQIDPNNADANRLLATMAERGGMRTAIDFRRRVVELGSPRASDILAWARCALRFGDDASARQALDRLPERERKTAEYHALRGDVALLARNPANYEKEMAMAQQLDPANKTYALALAGFRIAQGDAGAHAEGTRVLEGLRQDAATRHDATRRLAEDAIRRNDSARAIEHARALDAMPERDFSDRLLSLTALKLNDDKSAPGLLAQLQKECGDDPAKIAALLAWMNGQKLSRSAVEWMKTLPTTVLSQKTLPLTAADTLVAAKDWDGLEKFLGKANWGPVDFMRSALLARAAREAGKETEWAQQWNDATKKVGSYSDQVLLLAEMAQRWGWERESLDLLWLAAKNPKNADKTLGALYNFYAVKGDTQEIYRVLLHLGELHPNDHAVENNIAQLSLLLNMNVDRAHQLAHEVFQSDPKNADFASTYAFSLSLRGESRKAVETLAALPESELQRPPIAAYYAMVLVANNEFARAAPFLALGEKAHLLPEEKALLQKARLAVAQR